MSISKSINISFLFTTSIIAYTFLNGVSIAKAETPPEIISGLQIKATGRKIEIKPGKLNIKGKLVTVAKKNILKVEPAPVFKVENEALKLSVKPPKKYYRGTKLKGPKTKSGSLVPGSLLIRKTPGGEKLTAGKDYLLVEKFGTLGLSPGSRINANDTVYASYSYSKLRLDTVIINQQGEIKLIKGNAHFNVSLPARLEPGSVRLANIYRPYGAVEVKKEHIYPLLESATQAKTLSSSGRIPRTLAKLKSGKKVKIVCWGDSVTAGGDASSGKHRYVNVFSAGLRKKFPNADIEVINISLGGSNIRQWLQIDNFRYRRKMPTGRECDW
ncbi:MAG: SGNH/GDSL hydrolase family protein [Victivallaceae bacterium]|nr:SGNH/GDSL hydrolase family protein [Victivallaceae bacterium]